MTAFRRAIRPALWAALWGFLGPALLLMPRGLADVAEWASTSGRTPLPGLSTIGYALVAAACSAMTGLVAFVFRYLQATGLVAGQPPAYTPGERVPAEAGHADVSVITCIACVVTAIVLVAWAFTGKAPFAG
jgi:hypothetical protein